MLHPGHSRDTSEASLRHDDEKKTDSIELVRAHHETLIRQALVNWSAEIPTRSRGNPVLTRKQQSKLQELVVTMFVELGEARGRALLADSVSPKQFELDSDHLIESVADEARARWKALMGRYHVEAEAAGASVEVRERVHRQLTAVSDRLILLAWRSQKTQLEAECAQLALQALCLTIGFSQSLITSVPIRGEPDVDRKTGLGLENEGKGANPGTFKRVAQDPTPTGTAVVEEATPIKPSASLTTGNGLDQEVAAGHFDVSLDPEGRSRGEPESNVGSKPLKKRGRPAKISDELKQKAIEAHTGKARAQILYETKYPTAQQVKNVWSILRNYKRRSNRS